MRKLVAVFLLGAFGLALPNACHAAFRVRISDSSGVVADFVDDQAGFDLDPTDGSILFSSGASGVTIDNAQIVITTSLSKPQVGDLFSAEIDVSIDGSFTGNSATGFRVEVTDTDYAVLGGATGVLTAILSSNNDTGIGTSFSGYFDDGNAEFGHGVEAGPLTVDGTASVPDVPFTNPFSLTADTLVTNSGGAGASFSYDNRVIFNTPVPAGMVLALSALPVLGLGYLRRRKATKAETVA